jgi:hypothetical protein
MYINLGLMIGLNMFALDYSRDRAGKQQKAYHLARCSILAVIFSRCKLKVTNHVVATPTTATMSAISTNARCGVKFEVF